MKILPFIFLLITIDVFGQAIENSANLKRYKTVETILGKSKNGWRKLSKLSNGKIVQTENYLRNELRQRVIFIYDSINDVTTEVKKYDSNRGEVSDTLKYFYTWNKLKQLVERKDEFGCIEKYSNFDSKNLPQLLDRINCPLDSLFGYREEYLYDEKGDIIFEKIFSKVDNQFQIEFNKYKFDQYNNVIEVNRSAEPKQDYPIQVTGGRFRYENEKYLYIYNKYGLWTKQFWIVEKEKHLIARRKYK